MPGANTERTDDVAGAARPAIDPHVDPPLERSDVSGETDSDGVLDATESAEPDPLTVDQDAFGRESRPAPPRVADLAGACVRFVAARYGVTLAYEPDTLSFIDQWVRDARAELGRRPEAADLVQSAAGAYLGEVFRRWFGGEWALAEDYSDFRLCLAPAYCAFNPIGMVREALLLEHAEGWHAHFELDPAEREGIELRLAALPAVDSDEFFAPSTRFDVVDIVVGALRADMHRRGLGDVAFTVADYDLR